MRVAGDIIIFVGMVFILFGVFGIIKYKNFYTRILVTAKIDTVGAFTIIVGTAVKHGFGAFSLKALLLMGIMIVINPLASHMIARSAHLSGYRPDGRTGGDADGYSEEHL